MALNIEEQYDKIYRYCYLRVHSRETAEDITQETFLRYLEKPVYGGTDTPLRILYTIARNLCTDEYRKKKTEELSDELPADNDIEDTVLTNILLREALDRLSDEERELVLMRYVNNVPLAVMAELYDMSRFALNRKLRGIIRRLHNSFGEEK